MQTEILFSEGEIYSALWKSSFLSCLACFAVLRARIKIDSALNLEA